MAIFFSTIVEKVVAGRKLIVDETRKLTGRHTGNVAKIFQEISIILAIAFSKFLKNNFENNDYDIVSLIS